MLHDLWSPTFGLKRPQMQTPKTQIRLTDAFRRLLMMSLAIRLLVGFKGISWLALTRKTEARDAQSVAFAERPELSGLILLPLA